MALAGMVFMGEYTSGCVCTVPGQVASRELLVAAAEAGAGAGATGVVMQMRFIAGGPKSRSDGLAPN
jgi:hypothetical protein